MVTKHADRGVQSTWRRKLSSRNILRLIPQFQDPFLFLILLLLEMFCLMWVLAGEGEEI